MLCLLLCFGCGVGFGCGCCACLLFEVICVVVCVVCCGMCLVCLFGVVWWFALLSCVGVWCVVGCVLCCLRVVFLFVVVAVARVALCVWWLCLVCSVFGVCGCCVLWR